jgi:hypothetical protein
MQMANKTLTRAPAERRMGPGGSLKADMHIFYHTCLSTGIYFHNKPSSASQCRDPTSFPLKSKQGLKVGHNMLKKLKSKRHRHKNVEQKTVEAPVRWTEPSSGDTLTY